MSIDAVWKMTLEQFLKVLENGSATFTDKNTGEQITITREEIGTKYLGDPGYLAALELLNNVQKDMHRLYGYEHTDFAVKSLEAYKAEIIESNPELAGKSSVGFTTILQDGQTIPIGEDSRLFINGVEENSDYTFSAINSASGTELCSCFYFPVEGYGAIDLGLATDLFYVIEALADERDEVIDGLDEFVDYAQTVTSNVDLLSSINSLKTLQLKKGGIFASQIPDKLQQLISLCEEFPNSTALANKSSLEIAIFPELKTIRKSRSAQFLYGSTHCEILKMPKLETIEDAYSATPTLSPLGRVPYVEIPETAQYIGAYATRENRNIIIKAESAVYHENWCDTTPTGIFEIAVDNFESEIHLEIAAANWTENQYVELFKKLHSYEGTPTLKHLTLNATGQAVALGVYCDIPGHESEVWEEYLGTIGWTAT